MNVEIIKLDPRIARIHYLDYRKKCRENRLLRAQVLADKAVALDKDVARLRLERNRVDKEDEELLKAYRALYRGQQIIDLPKTIGRGGLDDKKMPRLAVSRADATKCYFRVESGTVYMHFREPDWRERNKIGVFRFRSPIVPPELSNGTWRSANNYATSATALVPTVPPHLRPANLEKFYILWEAEWTAKAPVDPLLLSKVNETMYAIVAQWDLTPLEQRVLEGRL